MRRRQRREQAQMRRRRAHAGVTALLLVDIVANTLAATALAHREFDHGLPLWTAVAVLVLIIAGGTSAGYIWTHRRRPEHDKTRDTTGLRPLSVDSGAAIDEVVDLHLMVLILSSASLGVALDIVLSGTYLFGDLLTSIAALFGIAVVICCSAARLFALRGAPRLLPLDQDENPPS